MKYLARFTALVFLLLLSKAALATAPVAPDSTISPATSMYQWGMAEGRTYANIIKSSSLEESERVAAHAASKDDADQNIDDAIAAKDKTRLDFWEGYYRGLGEMQPSSQLSNQKTADKRFYSFVTRPFIR